MKKISRRSFLALSGSAALLMAVNPLMANAAITEPELKSYYVAPFGESGTIQLDNSEHGTITIRPDTPIQGRANGDPVIHGTYTVEYNSIGSHFEYKVDTNSSYKITAAYDLDYTTVHEILSHSLTHTSTMASLKIEFKYFSVAGTANASTVPISIGELTASTLKAISVPLSDWFIMKRIEELLKRKVFQLSFSAKSFSNSMVLLNNSLSP